MSAARESAINLDFTNDILSASREMLVSTMASLNWEKKEKDVLSSSSQKRLPEGFWFSNLIAVLFRVTQGVVSRVDVELAWYKTEVP